MTRRAGQSGDVHDRDFTPDLLARACVCSVLDHLGHARRPVDVLDMGTGDGAFSRAWHNAIPRPGIFADAVDIDPDAEGLQLARAFGRDGVAMDARQLAGRAARWDAIVGNPSFALAVELTIAALDVADVCAWILPATFMQGTKGKRDQQGNVAQSGRRDFWLNPPAPIAHVWPILDRPSFRRDGKTDATSYQLVMWDHHHTGPALWGPFLAAPTDDGWGVPYYRDGFRGVSSG